MSSSAAAATAKAACSSEKKSSAAAQPAYTVSDLPKQIPQETRQALLDAYYAPGRLHIWICGASGSGKSLLALHVIKHMIGRNHVHLFEPDDQGNYDIGQVPALVAAGRHWGVFVDIKMPVNCFSSNLATTLSTNNPFFRDDFRFMMICSNVPPAFIAEHPRWRIVTCTKALEEEDD